MILNIWDVLFLSSRKGISTICSSVRIEVPLANVALSFFPVGFASIFRCFAVMGDMNECELPESIKKVKGLPS